MSKGIRSTKIPDYRLIVRLLLVCLFICDWGLLRLIDFNKCIAIDFIVFEGRVAFNNLIIASSISFSTLQVFQMNISQHFSTLNKISWVCLHCLQDAHRFLNIVWLNCYISIGEQHMNLLISASKLRDCLCHNLLRLFLFVVFHVAFGQQKIYWASVFLGEAQYSEFFISIF